MIESIPGLGTLLRFFQKERHHRSDKYNEALEALHKAVHETNKHYSIGLDSAEEQMELSNLWALAAIKARNLSKELAKACYIKSGYWKDPDEWTFRKVESNHIELTRFEEELERLIKK